MSDYHFPDLTEHALWSIKTIFTLACENPKYLNDPDCPYDMTLKEIIQRAVLFKPPKSDEKPADAHSIPVTVELIDSNIDVDLYSVFIELKNYGKTIGQSDQTERMAYFRTATTLLERLVGARERALGIKQIRDFQDTVLTIMEEVLSADQRTEVMDRLRQAIRRRDTEGLDFVNTTTEGQDAQ